MTLEPRTVDVVAPPPNRPIPAGPVPTFSVIVAVHQGADTIGDAIDSALAQDPPPLEVVVCDDGSTDDIEGAVARFGDRVRLLRRPHGGEAAAKNAAAAAAIGEFVVILDADDVFLPGRLHALGELAAARPDLDILTTDAYLEVHGKRIARCYEGAHQFETGDQRAGILRRNFVFGLAAIRRLRFVEVGGFAEEVRHSADWDCWIRLILSGSTAGLVPEPLALYRLHESSMNADRLAMYRGRATTLGRTLARPDLTDEERVVLQARVDQEARRIAVEELAVTLVAGRRGARAVAARLARTPGVSRQRRLHALAAVICPGLMSRLVRRRRAGYWVAVGDRRVPRS